MMSLSLPACLPVSLSVQWINNRVLVRVLFLTFQARCFLWATDVIFTQKPELQQWRPIKNNTLTAQLFESHRMTTFHQVFLLATTSPELTLQNIAPMEVFPTWVLVPILSRKRRTTYSRLNSMVHQDPVDLQGRRTLKTLVHQRRQFALWYFRSWCHSCWLGSGRCQLGFCWSWFRWGRNCLNCTQVFIWLDCTF